jgi:hypothetical protein
VGELDVVPTDPCDVSLPRLSTIAFAYSFLGRVLHFHVSIPLGQFLEHLSDSSVTRTVGPCSGNPTNIVVLLIRRTVAICL